MKKIIIILIIAIVAISCINICYAQTVSVSGDANIVYCGDGAYLNIAKDTFKKPTKVTCGIATKAETNNLKNNITYYGNIYKITMVDEQTNQELHFARQEMPLIIPKANIKNVSEEQYLNIKGYIYDDLIHDWISTNGNDQGATIETKIMKSGYVTLLAKQPDSFILDKYFLIAFTTLCIGLIFVIIKVK